MAQDTWESTLSSRDDLAIYGDNAVGLFALGLRFDIDDLASVASDSITDGYDDKKCDLVYINTDEQAAVVAQCYTAKNPRPAAPANKAADLNTAMAWLLHSPIQSLPTRIKSSASDLRDAITAQTVTDLHVWYVHNLPESKNVKQELATVEASVQSALKSDFAGSSIRLHVREVGTETLATWYADSLTPILVNDSVSVIVRSGFPVKTEQWEAYVTVIPAAFLYTLCRKYKTKLFSANVRDYLGSRKSDLNINNGIKQTVVNNPDNFWVYNNGLTMLVNDFSVSQLKGTTRLTIRGMSIVNGAQTTGAVGTLSKKPLAAAYVPIRLIKTTNREIIYDIIRFNNSQNKVTASDFRSTDRTQKRLKEEMLGISNAEYEGGRRGGHEDIIRRRANLLPSYTVGQALAAFHGDPIIAYNQKSEIWISDSLYARYFNDETTARHIVCAYALLRAVEAKKFELIQKSRDSATGLTNAEGRQLDFFRNRGATYLFTSAVSSCMEIFVSRRVINAYSISFGLQSPDAVEKAWKGIVEITAPLCFHLEDAFTDGLKNTERVKKAIQTFQSLVEVTAAANHKSYADFATRISLS